MYSGACGYAAGDTIVELAPNWTSVKSLTWGSPEDELPPASGTKLFKIRFADDDGRRRSARFLVQRRYAWRGYNVSAASDVQPSRITLSAFDGDSVIATITVGLDSAQGLFVDGLFHLELARLRAAGRRVCEFTRLAIDEAIRSKALLASLFHIAYIHARRLGACTDLVIEVNPRHERLLGFRMLGCPQRDPRVNAPASLLHLDLTHAEAQTRKLGGNPAAAATMRSLYPFFFSRDEEFGIEARLRAHGA